MFNSMLKRYLANKFADVANTYINSKCRECNTTDGILYTIAYAKAVGAHALALHVCEKFKIDPMTIHIPGQIMNEQRKEVTCQK